MPEHAQRAVSPLDGAIAAGLHGRSDGPAGVVVTEMRSAGLASITARNDRRSALIAAVRAAYGVELPATPRHVLGHGMAFIWSGPDQWFAHAEHAPAAGMEATLAECVRDLASIVDQSHGRVVLRVTGPHVRAALAKGLAIDLHPRSFQTGHAAATTIAHVGVHLWQRDEAPTYEFAVSRSLALSFWHWLASSSAEFGLEFVASR